MIKKIINKIFIGMQQVHRSYIADMYRNSDYVSLGFNVKFPYIENGPPNYGKIIIGDNSWLSGTINMFPHNKDVILQIGDDCYIGDNTRIWCAKRIKIGNRVLIAHNVNIFDTSTHPIDKKIRYEHEKVVKNSGLPADIYEDVSESPVIINDDVWIGCNSIILKGIEIGEGSIIAAGSIVVENVPPNTMVAGNPATVVKKLYEE